MNFTVSFADLLPLLPVMIIAIATIVALLAVVVQRHHGLVAGITLGALTLSAFTLVQKLYHQTSPAEVMGLFIVDSFAYSYMLMIVLAAIVCCILSFDYIKRYQDHKEELYILILASVVGAMMMVASSHYASFFISLETMSIPIYGMLAYTYQRQQSLEAGIKYLVLSATASAMLLMGLAYLYAYTGEMNFVNSALKILPVATQPLVVLGLALVVFACGFKLSLAPFHKWTPDVYHGASTPMVAFLASAAKVAMLGLFLRYILTSGTLFTTSQHIVIFHGIETILIVIAILSIILGNVLAVQQHNIKRIFAYSSIAHFGYMLTAIISAKVTSLSAVTTYIAVYALTTVGAFGVIAIMSSPYNNRTEMETLEDYQGLFWHRPLMAITMTVMLLSMAGIPLTAGFIAKFTIFISLVSNGSWLLVAALIIGSGIGLYYYLRVMINLYKKPEEETGRDFITHQDSQNLSSVVVVTMITLLIVVLGIYPQPLLEFAMSAGLAVLQK